MVVTGERVDDRLWLNNGTRERVSRLTLAFPSRVVSSTRTFAN